MKPLRNRPMAQPLKDSDAYRAAREAALARMAVETPDTWYLECSDCCWLERVPMQSTATNKCPECGGGTLWGMIRNGEVRP